MRCDKCGYDSGTKHLETVKIIVNGRMAKVCGSCYANIEDILSYFNLGIIVVDPEQLT